MNYQIFKLEKNGISVHLTPQHEISYSFVAQKRIELEDTLQNILHDVAVDFIAYVYLLYEPAGIRYIFDGYEQTEKYSRNEHFQFEEYGQEIDEILYLYRLDSFEGQYFMEDKNEMLSVLYDNIFAENDCVELAPKCKQCHKTDVFCECQKIALGNTTQYDPYASFSVLKIQLLIAAQEGYSDQSYFSKIIYRLANQQHNEKIRNKQLVELVLSLFHCSLNLENKKKLIVFLIENADENDYNSIIRDNQIKAFLPHFVTPAQWEQIIRECNQKQNELAGTKDTDAVRITRSDVFNISDVLANIPGLSDSLALGIFDISTKQLLSNFNANYVWEILNQRLESSVQIPVSAMNEIVKVLFDKEQTINHNHIAMVTNLIKHSPLEFVSAFYSGYSNKTHRNLHNIIDLYKCGFLPPEVLHVFWEFIKEEDFGLNTENETYQERQMRLRLRNFRNEYGGVVLGGVYEYNGSVSHSDIDFVIKSMMKTGHRRKHSHTEGRRLNTINALCSSAAIKIDQLRQFIFDHFESNQDKRKIVVNEGFMVKDYNECILLLCANPHVLADHNILLEIWDKLGRRSLVRETLAAISDAKNQLPSKIYNALCASKNKKVQMNLISSEKDV